MSNLFNNMGIDVGFIVILLMVVVIVLVIMLMINIRATRILQRQYRSFMKGMDGASLEQTFRKKFSQISNLVNVQEQQESDLDLLHIVQDKSLTKYGIVKYDAFEDVGGKLSFALALLDKRNNGFVINAIHSKENCFIYLKEIVKGESYIMLSDEELEALRAAEKYGDEDRLFGADD